MWGLLKAGWGIVAPFKMWMFGLVAAGGVLISILVFYGNCKKDSALLVKAEDRIVELEDDLLSKDAELARRNERIRSMNAQRLEELAANEMRIKAAEEIARIAQAERDVISEELAVARFEIVEAIRDDEEMADWVDGDVPVSAWVRLWDTAEGRID